MEVEARNVESVIARLRAAKEPSRNLDRVISDFMASINCTPAETDPAKVPHFTRDIDSAYGLADIIAPRCFGGVAWDGGVGRAQINNGPKCEAPTPAMALCIASLSELVKQIRSGR
jgi:hypothetical protein